MIVPKFMLDNFVSQLNNFGSIACVLIEVKQLRWQEKNSWFH